MLGATTHSVDDVTGAIVESDIFLNSNFAWSVAPGGEAQRFDVQSIATHEIGHLLGLGHSALGETELRPDGGRRVLGKNAVMFPIAFPAGNIADRVLKPTTSPASRASIRRRRFSGSLGSITGRVTLNNAGLFGAHVTAFNPSTGALVGAFALDQQGNFTIDGLPPGVYVVRVEPLDDGDLDSFFDDGHAREHQLQGDVLLQARRRARRRRRPGHRDSSSTQMTRHVASSLRRARGLAPRHVCQSCGRRRRRARRRHGPRATTASSSRSAARGPAATRSAPPTRTCRRPTARR